MKSRLFHRHFTLMIAGQVVSLFGNAILRFALSLYVLDLTGSAAVFGTILALSMIPTILFSPLGGVLADRVPRQRIMALLDFATAALILLTAFPLRQTGSVALIAVLMMALTLIQAFYQPSVQASIPALTREENLMAANGVVVQVQALSALLGPILGGFLYGFFPILPILLVSAACFFCSAVMELFLRIPFVAQARTASALRQIKGDLTQAVRFAVRKNPSLIRLLGIIAFLNLFLSSLFTVGLPYLVKVTLGLSAELYGFAQAAMGLGSILGGLISGFVGKRVPFRRSHLFLLITIAALLPVVPALASRLAATAIYAVLLVCVLLSSGFCVLFNISAQTFLQKQTPPHLLGKVSAFVATVCTCAMPLGQALYGWLFEWLGGAPWAVMLFGCTAGLLLTLAARRVLRGVGEEPAADDLEAQSMQNPIR